MYSGILPKDLTEDDLSPDEEVGDVEGTGGRSAGKSKSVLETQSNPEATNIDSNDPTCGLPGISKEMWQVCRFGYIRRERPY